MEERDVVGDLFQIRCDMGGQQNRMAFVLHEVQENIQDVVPHDGIQARCGFIKNQQAGMVGQTYRQIELHLHALAEIFQRFFLRQIELPHAIFPRLAVPAAVDGAADGFRLLHVQIRAEMRRIENHADSLPDAVGIFRQLFSVKFHASAVSVKQFHGSLYGRGLACAVFSDQANHRSGGYGQIHVLQAEIAEVLPQTANLQRICCIRNGIHKSGSSS